MQFLQKKRQRGGELTESVKKRERMKENIPYYQVLQILLILHYFSKISSNYCNLQFAICKKTKTKTQTLTLGFEKEKKEAKKKRTLSFSIPCNMFDTELTRLFVNSLKNLIFSCKLIISCLVSSPSASPSETILCFCLHFFIYQNKNLNFLLKKKKNLSYND